MKKEKIVAFFKKNGYYFVMATCIIAIITMVTLSLVFTLGDSPSPDDNQTTLEPSNPSVDKPSTPATPDDPTEPTTPVSPTEPDEPSTPTTPVEPDEPTTPVTPSDPDSPDEKVDAGAPFATFIVPVTDGVIIKPYSKDSLVFNTSLKKYETHLAIDYKGADGANVLASGDGVVESVTEDKLYGYVITILHENGIKTLYGSVDNVTVKTGDEVKRGDKIATIGTTAGREKADGPHVHFQVIKDGEIVDPATLFDVK